MTMYTDACQKAHSERILGSSLSQLAQACVQDGCCPCWCLQAAHHSNSQPGIHGQVMCHDTMTQTKAFGHSELGRWLSSTDVCGLPVASSHANPACTGCRQKPACPKQDELTGRLRRHVDRRLPAGRCLALGAESLLRETWHPRHALRHAWHAAREPPCAPKWVGSSRLCPLPLHHGLHGLLHELQAEGLVSLGAVHAKGALQGLDAPHEACLSFRAACGTGGTGKDIPASHTCMLPAGDLWRWELLCLSTQVFAEQVQLNLKKVCWHRSPLLSLSACSRLSTTPQAGKACGLSGALVKACIPLGARCSSSQCSAGPVP